MKAIKEIISKLSGQLDKLAKGNAVVARPISVGDRHVIPLCELSIGFGGGGGTGEGTNEDAGKGSGSGTGAGAGGGAKATPVAVLVIDGGRVRIESLAK